MKKLILLSSLFLLSSSAFAINERGEYEEEDFKNTVIKQPRR